MKLRTSKYIRWHKTVYEVSIFAPRAVPVYALIGGMIGTPNRKIENTLIGAISP